MASRSGTCSTCGAVFSSATRGKIPVYCQACRYQRQLAASQRWKARNPEHIRMYRSVHDAAHRDENIVRCRRWYRENKDKIRIYRKRLYEERQKSTNTAAVLEYRRRNPGKHAEIENRRRSRLLGQFVAAVDPRAIRERDRDLCGICNKPVPPTERSLDHITPISLGGTHEPSNVQLAHRRCNSRKGNRVAA